MATTDVYRFIQAIHPLLDDGGRMSGLVQAVQAAVDNLDTSTGLARDGFAVEKARGKDLDLLGAVINSPRKASESDNTYRQRLLDRVSGDYKTQTKQAIKDLVEEITGVTVELEEWPDVDFVNDHGLPANVPAFLVRVPFNKAPLMADVERQADTAKAGGVMAVTDINYDLFSESFVDVITVSDFLAVVFGDPQYSETLSLLEELGGSTGGYFTEPEPFSPFALVDSFQDGVISSLFSLNLATLGDGDLTGSLAGVFTINLQQLSAVHGGHLERTGTEALSQLSGWMGGTITGLLDSSLDSLVDVIGGVIAGSFTSRFQSFAGWDNGYWDEETWDHVDDVFDYLVYSRNSEALTPLAGEFYGLIESLRDLSLDSLADTMDAVSIVHWLTLASMADEIYGTLSGAFVDGMTPLDGEELLVKCAFIAVSLATPVEGDLTFDGELLYPEILSTLLEELAGEMDYQISDPLERAYRARIGTAKIGIDTLVGDYAGYFDSKWDGGEWDEARWDEDMSVSLMELF